MFFELKYNQSNRWYLLKSLKYIDNADREEVRFKLFDNITSKEQKYKIIAYMLQERLSYIYRLPG